MTTLIFFIIQHLISIAVAAISLKRLYTYIRRYRFDESKYTLLFGFVHLRLVVAFYLFTAIIWVPVSYFLFFRI